MLCPDGHSGTSRALIYYLLEGPKENNNNVYGRRRMSIQRSISLCGLFLILSLSLSGCSYLAERGNDLKDVLTIAVEDKGAHVGLQALTLVTGLGYAKGRGFGLRNGTSGVYEYSEFSLGVIGRKSFSTGEQNSVCKNCDFMWATPVFLPQVDQHQVEPKREGGYATLGNSSVGVCPWNIEVTACLGVGLRLGLNLAEFFDFAFGLVGFDILKDDTKSRQ